MDVIVYRQHNKATKNDVVTVKLPHHILIFFHATLLLQVYVSQMHKFPLLKSLI